MAVIRNMNKVESAAFVVALASSAVTSPFVSALPINGAALQGQAGATSGVQTAYDLLYAKWSNPGFASATDAGVLAHVGLFGKPVTDSTDYQLTWNPALCASTDLLWTEAVGDQVPAGCGRSPPSSPYNVFSMVPSSMTAAKSSVSGDNARGQLYRPDFGSVGCADDSSWCPAKSAAGIIIDHTKSSWMCAYAGDVASNTWSTLCPVTGTFNPVDTVDSCGTCKGGKSFGDECAKSTVLPDDCDFQTGPLMHTGASMGYYPYNEFDVYAPNVTADAVLAIFYLAGGLTEAQAIADANTALTEYKKDTGNDLPLIKVISSESNPKWQCMNCN
jgi:hypothetical protein